MMSSNDNFLLKIHMEEDKNTTEIYLNKERRSFTFIDDECISDLIIPEFKITSLNMILENISDRNGDDTYYAEYEKDNEIVREYDKEKIHILSNMITRISINDFIDYQKDIKINDYYVDNVIDTYECVLPTEMQKILSYTTNGVVFNGEETIYFMPHEDITGYDGLIKNFIPFMIRKGKSYIGYDYKESLYKEYLEEKVIKEGKTLKDIIELKPEESPIMPEEQIEKLEEDEEEIELIGETEDLETEIAKTDEEYENTIKNIEYQFERLNSGIVQKEKEEPYQYKEKKVETIEEIKEEDSNEQQIIKDEIRESVRKSLDEMEKTDDLIDEIDNDIEKVITKAKTIKEANKKAKKTKEKDKKEIAKLEAEIKNLKDDQKQAEKIVTKEKIGPKAEEILEELNLEITKLEELKNKMNSSDVNLPKNFEVPAEEILIKLIGEIKKVTDERNKNKQKATTKLEAEIKNLKADKKQAEKIVTKEKIGPKAEEILEELNLEIIKLEELKNEIISSDINLPKKFEVSAEETLIKLIGEIKKVTDERNKSKQKAIAKLEAEIKNLKADKKQAEKIVSREGIGKKAEDILEELNLEITKLEDLKTKINSSDINLPKRFEVPAEETLIKLIGEIKNVTDEKNKTKQKANAKLDAEIKNLKADKKQAEKIVSREGIGQKAEEILEELNLEIIKLEELKNEIISSDINLPKRFEIPAEEALIKLIGEIKTVTDGREKLKREAKEKQAKEDEKDIICLSNLINNSINSALDNYQINFNDTQKLVVEHLPYYEFSNDFSVIQIPEIDLDRLTLLPDSEINLGKIKLTVAKLQEEQVTFTVNTTANIVDKNGNKIKKGDQLVLDLKNEITLRLNKKSAMETWSLKMEKSTFEKELRNVDFKKIMSYIVDLESYNKLGNIEKYELQKSIMLFINLVMENKDEKTLDELYKILEKKPTLYEEFITKYNNKHSLALKDSLATYDEKKSYLTKLNYVNGLIDAKWLDYPRYIFNAHNYFYGDDFLEEFIDELDNALGEKDFYDYLMKLFNEYEVFTALDEEGRSNLEKCIEYLSILYKHRPDLGEDNKYKIERTFMIGATEEEMSLLIAKLCRRGIKDYSIFVEYDRMMKEKYRLGELKYPIFSEYFEIEEIRNGGEYDEF